MRYNNEVMEWAKKYYHSNWDFGDNCENTPEPLDYDETVDISDCEYGLCVKCPFCDKENYEAFKQQLEDEVSNKFTYFPFCGKIAKVKE